MIRDIQWNDFKEVIENYYSYYDELENNPDLGLVFQFKKPDLKDEIKWFSNLYSSVLKGDALAVVAVEEGKVVGLCDVNRIRPETELQHNGLLGIAIRKEFRGSGIGKELMAAMLERCRGKFETIVLDVFTTNKNAISLYKKFGFVEYGLLPNAVKRGNRYFDELKMYCELKEPVL